MLIPLPRLSESAFEQADVCLKNLTLAVVHEGDEVDAHDDKLSAAGIGQNSEELKMLKDADMQRLAAVSVGPHILSHELLLLAAYAAEPLSKHLRS